MKQIGHLKKYTILLKTTSPLYIGGGEDCKLSKLQYYFNLNTKEFCIIDEAKFGRFLIKNNLLESFVDYIKNNRNTQLWLFFEKQGIQEPSKLDIFSKIQTLKNTKAADLNDIRLFIKNINGHPYIPGSSIKGAIKTALLYSFITKNKENLKEYWMKADRATQTDIRNCKKELNRIITDLEREAFSMKKFGSPQTDSIFRGLQISDSKAINKDNLYIAKKEDLDAKSGEIKGLPIYREYLKSYTETKFSITIDDTLFPYSIEDVMSALNDFTKFQDKMFKENYNVSNKNIYLPLNKEECKPNLCIGGGSGFLTKTAIYSLAPFEIARKITARYLDMAFRKGSQINSKIAPKMLKLAKENNDYLCIGLCRLSLIEDK